MCCAYPSTYASLSRMPLQANIWRDPRKIRAGASSAESYECEYLYWQMRLHESFDLKEILEMWILNDRQF